MHQMLAEGHIRLVSCAWIRTHVVVNVLRRRQDLPSEAFLSPEEAAAVWERARRLVAVLSYRWLTALHPDPNGQHLVTLRAFLVAHPAFVGVFIDFAS